MKKLSTQENRKCQIYILDYLKKICIEEKLDYYLIGGTLIGSVRHQGFIPWDDDIDIAMPLKDYQKLKQIIIHKYAERFELLDFLDDNNYILNFGKLGLNGTYFKSNNNRLFNSNKISIDIFPLFLTKQNSFYLKLKYFTYRRMKKILLLANNIYKKMPRYIKNNLIIKSL